MSDLLSFFLLDILFIYISNVIPFSTFPSRNLLSHPPSPCFYEGAFLPTYPLLPHLSSIPLYWGIESPQNQGPPIQLMPYKAIFCYIYSWSHGSLHVYSLVGGLVPGSSGGTGWFILLLLLWGCKHLQLLVSFLYVFHWGSCAQFNGWL